MDEQDIFNIELAFLGVIMKITEVQARYNEKLPEEPFGEIEEEILSRLNTLTGKLRQKYSQGPDDLPF